MSVVFQEGIYGENGLTLLREHLRSTGKCPAAVVKLSFPFTEEQVGQNSKFFCFLLTSNFLSCNQIYETDRSGTQTHVNLNTLIQYINTSQFSTRTFCIAIRL